MTPIYQQQINHPSAWTHQSVGGKDNLKVALSAEQIGAIDELLARTAHLRPQEVTRADFDHPVVNRLLASVREEIMNGRGLLIITGITPQRYDEEQFERIYWGFGTHLGNAAVQSASGDRLGRVETDPDDRVNRGYRSLQELNMHTDSYEVVGLMSVRKAKEGGFSGMASSLAIHNEIFKTRPELLEPLYRGFRYAIAEAKFSSKPVTDEAIPVFSCVDGKVSCMYASSFMRVAAEKLGVPLPADLAEAIAYFNELSGREDLAMNFMLEPGEMMLWHNFTTLHSRTSFEDEPGRKRLLLRLWLNVPGGRPCDPAIQVRAATYDRLYKERQAAG